MLDADGFARLRRRVTADPALSAVVALTLIALLLRVVFLGDRIAHFDEGRVAYWALHYQETGQIAYQYIVHGTFVQYVDAVFFTVLGQSDTVARLPLALFGGLLPLSALLFRRRLRGVEVVGVAAFLALNPVLLYYSRFLRSTLLVAGFCFLAFGCLVRALDTRQVRYVYAASVLLALAFASKENAVIYLVVWIGALGVLLVQALFWPWRDRRARARLRDWWSRSVDRVRSGGRGLGLSLARHAVGVLGVFLLVSLFFFAPRNPGEGVGLWGAIADPTRFPALLDTTITDIVQGYDYWFGGSTEPGCYQDTLLDSYVCYLGAFLETLGVAAGPLVLLAIGGLVLELAGRDRPRPLVTFAAAWGVASVVGYPLGMDIRAGWVTVNAIVPLTVLAAVGLGWLLRQGLEAHADGDTTSVVIVAIVLAVLTAQVGAVAADTVYQRPVDDHEDHVLVQFAQPADDYRPAFDRVRTVAGDEPGPHVVLYGDTLRADGSSPISPSCANLQEVLPMQWYFATADFSVTCATDPAEFDEAVGDRQPPLVITRDADDPLRSRLDGYVERTYHNRAIGDLTTFLVRPDVADDARLGGHDPSGDTGE